MRADAGMRGVDVDAEVDARRYVAERDVGSDSIAQAVGHLSEGLSTLVKGHLALARLEMARDARALGRDFAVAGAGVPLVFVGYLLLWMAVGFLLALVLPGWAAFGLCALVNLAVGGAMLGWGGKHSKKDAKLEMPASAEELRKDKAWLPQLREPAAPVAATRAMREAAPAPMLRESPSPA